MYEYERFEYEFSKIYKRLLRLELLIKNKLVNSVIQVHKNNVMTEFHSFFYNEHIYKCYYDEKKINNLFLEIRDNNTLIDEIKFEKIINLLTLRHLLFFIFNEKSFRHIDVIHKFYSNVPNTYKELRDGRRNLVKLRNYIAHFNFKEYNENKKLFLETLLLYEIHLGSSLGKYNKIPSHFKFKPNAPAIIRVIYELAPELFQKAIPHSNFPYNKDRIIVDMYEEIAVLNGWEYTNLPSQWSIIRTRYKFSEKLTKRGVKNLEIPGQQMLFDISNWS